MAILPTPDTPGAGTDDAQTFAALMQRAGRALHTMSAALRRRGLWLVFGTLGGLIGGIAVAVNAKPVVNPHRYYKATVSLTLTDSAMTAGTTSSVGWSFRLAQLAATTDAYRRLVAEQTGTSPTYVKNHITVIANPEISRLDVTAIDIDPDLTAQVAYHAATALNEAAAQSVTARIDAQKQQLASSLTDATRVVTTLNAIIDKTPKTKREPLLAQLSTAQGQVEFIQYQRDSLDVSPPKFAITSMPEAVRINADAYYLRWSLARSDVGAARIQANAKLIDAGLARDTDTERMLKILANETQLTEVKPISASSQVALGMLAGLMLGLSGVVLGEAWDERIHDTEHALQTTGFELLTEIPRLSRRAVVSLLRDGRTSKVDRVVQAASRYQEAAAILAHQMGIGRSTQGQQAESDATTNAPVVLVTSATPSEGKSTSAAALAASFARLGLRVLAVDGDYHRRSLHKNVRPIPNFVDPNLPCDTRIDGVWLLDEPAARRSKLSNTATVTRLLRRVEAQRRFFDVIVLDTPPILITTDASDFLHHADAVALVVRIEQTLTPSCERAGTLIRHREVPVSGLIVTDVPLKVIDQNYGSGG